MKIPAHWSKATAEDTDKNGQKLAFSCWRSSDHSPEDARQSALEAAGRVLQKMLAGKRLDRYGYGNAPMREEVVERFTDVNGQLTAAVTRNAYGAMVLNTAQAMFIDLDFPPTSPGEELKHFFARIFNKSAIAPDARREADVRDRLDRFVGDHRNWAMRVYRTCAGLRALVTHDLFDPVSSATQAVFDTLGTDPLYVRLCKAQQCFRARLTPKPWRAGYVVNTIAWPRETEEQQAGFQEWLADYKAVQARYATCRFLGAIGSGMVHPELETIIEVHDKVTRCGETLTLA